MARHRGRWQIFVALTLLSGCGGRTSLDDLVGVTAGTGKAGATGAGGSSGSTDPPPPLPVPMGGSSFGGVAGVPGVAGAAGQPAHALEVIKVVNSDGAILSLDLAVGTDGNVTAVGYYDSPIDFGSGWVLGNTVDGSGDSFIATVDPLGNTVAASALGGPGEEMLRGVVRDSNNAMTASGDPITSLVRMGEPEWPIKSFDNASNEDVAAAPNGDIVTVGRIQGKTDFGGGQVEPDLGLSNAFATSFDAAGNWRWDYIINSDESYARHVVADAAGNALVLGYFNGTLDLGTDKYVAVNEDDLFILRLTPDGIRTYSSTYSCEGGRMKGRHLALVPEDGGFVVVGELQGTVDFGNGVTLVGGDSTTGFVEGFVVRFDSHGTALWGTTFESSEESGAHCVTVNSRGDILIGGFFRGDLLTPFNASADPDSHNAFVLALSGTDGSLLWQHLLGGAGEQRVDAIAIDSSFNIDTAYIAGGFYDQLLTADEVFAVPESALGSLFIAKLTP